jgi:hypothetical protein
VERTGDRYLVPMDTALHNYHQTTLPDGYSVAMGYLEIMGSPLISKYFLSEKEKINSFFYDSFTHTIKILIINCFIMFESLFQSFISDCRSLQNQEERLQGRITMNFGKKLNVGLDLDFLQAKGFYNSQSVKFNDLVFYGNYLSDRIETHFFASSAGITQYENGGISDDNFITQPDSIEQSFTSKDIPTRMSNTWNRLKTNQFYVSGRYNLGYKNKQSPMKRRGICACGQFNPYVSISRAVSTFFCRMIRSL